MSSAKTICDDDCMRSLRFRYLWLFGGLCLVGFVLYSTLMPSSSVTVSLLNDKVAHALAFLILMVWFCGVFKLRFVPLVAVALLLLGVLIELLQQQLTYRSAELADGLADIAGIGLGWVLAAAGLQYWSQWVESWFGPE
jgi:VanZ family protein